MSNHLTETYSALNILIENCATNGDTGTLCTVTLDGVDLKNVIRTLKRAGYGVAILKSEKTNVTMLDIDWE